MVLLRYLTLGVLCLCITLTVTTPAWAQELPTAADRAEQAIAAGEYDRALAALQSAISPTTTNTELLLLRARAYEGQSDFASARADYERVLAIDGANETARAGLNRVSQGTSRQNQGRLDVLRQRLQNNPDDLKLRLQYADALFDAEQFRQAAQQYGIYLEDVQGAPDIIQRYLVAIAQYEGDDDLGERIALEYLSYYRTDDDLWMRLGYFRVWQGKYDDAIDAFEQALLLNPNNRDAQRGLQIAQNPATLEGGGQAFPIDVLTAELRDDPSQDDKRWELIELLIGAGRFFEAQQNLEYFQSRYGDETRWQELYNLTVAELARRGGPGPAGPVGDIVDRLQADLRSRPAQDEKRYRLARELVSRNRYFEAYETLTEYEPFVERYGDDDRWLRAIIEIDDGLIRVTGESPIYEIDRLGYRLRFDPGNITTRYALVDALIEADRVQEAYDFILVAEAQAGNTPEYINRLQIINAERQRIAAARIVELENQLARNPNSGVALRELIDNYLVVGRSREVLSLYQRYLSAAEGDDNLRLQYAQALRQNGFFADALNQIQMLIQRNPNDDEYKRQYAITAISSGQISPLAQEYLDAVLERNPNDPEVIIELAAFRLSQGDASEADRLLRSAYLIGDARYRDRLETLSQLIEREFIRAEEDEHTAVLNEAQRLAKLGQYRKSIEYYERYFQLKGGRRTRTELRQVADIYSAARDFRTSLAIYDELQQQFYEYEIEKEIAKNQYYRADYAGAILTLEGMLQENNSDYEAWLLLGDSNRELERYTQAMLAYETAEEIAVDSRLARERMVQLGSMLSVSSGGNDYASVVAPVASATVARGGGTNYERYMQGMLAQITIPAPIVISAGIRSHFMSGTRRLIPDSETTRGRLNQVFAGAWLDLTPPVSYEVQTVQAPYTNRITVEGGIFDYEGGRTIGYGEARYWRQERGLYTASVGLRSTEGSLELWSPAGGEFQLRLNQFDVRGSTAAVFPDSLVKLSGVVAFNFVSDDFGLNSAGGSNFGTNVILDASYRVVPHTYLGISYYQLSYRDRTDIYFSPRDYQSYELFLEYEREMLRKWYFRVRGAVGIVARSSGFVSRRIEADWIYRFNDNLSFNLNGSVGQSSRQLGQQVAFDEYNTFILSGQLYWTL
ncbi:MAG: hypothetical protein RhofKO_26600 [Rhodothermales bacterium]